ncbi:MAG: peptide deformylase [Mariniphaga sp.]|nr:peptide deformylase [Mariniphaga sp.]
MIFLILKYGSPILRKQLGKVTEEDNAIQLSGNLFETLKKEGGIGLAAPQAGVLKRAFVIDTSSMIEDIKEFEKFEQFFLNPEILWKSPDEIYFQEGCLSIPGIYEDVLRADKITVSYFDINFNRIEEEFDGLKAWIFQHEYDHLEGILFIDRLSHLKRKLLTRKLNKIKNLKTKQHGSKTSNSKN